MDWNSGMRCLYAFVSGGILIADPDDLEAFQSAQIAHDIRPPITEADHAKLKHESSPDEYLYLDRNEKGRRPFLCETCVGELKAVKRQLAGAISSDHCLWSLHQNLQIEPRGTTPRVAQIKSNHIVKSYAAPALRSE